MGCLRCAAAEAFADGVEDVLAVAVAVLLDAALLLLLAVDVEDPSLPLPFDAADADGGGAFLIYEEAKQFKIWVLLFATVKSTHGGMTAGVESCWVKLRVNCVGKLNPAIGK